MSRICCSIILFASAAALLPAAQSSGTLPEVIEFNRHIRPIMSNTCFKCHGPDVKSNKSNLRLDIADLALAPHKNSKGRVTTPIVPGKPEQSEVWRRISTNDQGEIMPPADSLHQLSAADKLLFKRWIEQGAKYQPHWAYLAPTKAPLPPGSDAHPIDRFIRAELSARNLQPSPEADRRTLIRRVSLDLVGLPPTPDDVEAFLADQKPGAYERLVDRLLASEHYGERMAVPWLDLVRFADTVGFHGDQRQNIFPYRDYVIHAFNRNKPFDQFVVEQLAGDLLPNPTEEQRIATGYNRLNMMTREGGAQKKEYLAKYAADRVRTVSTTFLGSTMACAECHDHKFDPFSTKDFYAMSAYFADIKQWGVYSDYKYTPEPELKGFNNDFPFPPELDVESVALKRRLARLHEQFDARVKEVAKTLASDSEAFGSVRRWAAEVAPRLKAESRGWVVADVDAVRAAAATKAGKLPDQSVRFTDAAMAPGARKTEAKPNPTHVITLRPPAGPLATVRLEALPDQANGGRVARGKDDWFTLSLKLAVHRAGAENPEAIEVADAYPDGPTQSYFNAYLLPSVRGEWTSGRERGRERQSTDYLLRKPIVLAEGDRLVATVKSADIARIRISVSPLGGLLPGEQPSDMERAAFQTASPSAEQRELIAGRYFLSTGTGVDDAPFADALRDLHEIVACRDGKAFTMITVATEPAVTRVLPRGNWQDESGEVVLPAPPHFLTGTRDKIVSAPPPVRAGVHASLRPTLDDAENSKQRQNRLDLAKWIASRNNPLTARTFVNRLWKQFFGTGLSAVVDDLGLQGEYPSHPELLDWLAVEFMDRKWDVKAVVRLIVTSATYRQSSVQRPELREVDPQNRLLARQSPRRLEAEFVRDNALFAAGLLNLELGGPSATPYQPEGYYAQLNFPLRDYVAETDERQYRRGVYMHWQRTFLHPMLANFDAPSREECTAARTVSSTPQQALTLLNDPTFVEAARVLAEDTLRKAGNDFGAQLESMFLRVLARPPSERERASLQSHHAAQLAYYAANAADAAKLSRVGLHRPASTVDLTQLAALTSVARVILNLNETVVIY
jgi:hypothetical protein